MTRFSDPDVDVTRCCHVDAYSVGNRIPACRVDDRRKPRSRNHQLVETGSFLFRPQGLVVRRPRLVSDPSGDAVDQRQQVLDEALVERASNQLAQDNREEPGDEPL